MLLQDSPHRRFNPLTGEWILVSPHRAKRPWQGQVEQAEVEKKPEYDPHCYLCPGNERAGGKANPLYDSTFVFVNDFSALLPDVSEGEYYGPSVATAENPSIISELFRAESERGICKVICFSPKHNLTIPLLPETAIKQVIDVWSEEYRSIGAKPFINYVQIFENRGSAMGCSNPHPHGQIWSNQTVPVIPGKETERQQLYLERNRSCLLCDYLSLELQEKERIIIENDSFAVLVPFWAVWPYEVMLLSKRHAASLLDFNEKERRDLSSIMKRFGIRLDNLFLTNTPYSMGLHQKPTDGAEHPEWHFHIHYLPPLLRSATVKKFMVGYELLATVQRDISAELSAEKLRNCSETHFLDK